MLAVAAIQVVGILEERRSNNPATEAGSPLTTPPSPTPEIRQFDAYVVLPGMPVVPDYLSGTDSVDMMMEQLDALADPKSRLDCSEGTDEYPYDFVTGARVDVSQGGVVVDSTTLDKGTWNIDTDCRFAISFSADANGPEPEFMLPNGLKVGVDEYLGESAASVTMQ